MTQNDSNKGVRNRLISPCRPQRQSIPAIKVSYLFYLDLLDFTNI